MIRLQPIKESFVFNQQFVISLESFSSSVNLSKFTRQNWWNQHPKEDLLSFLFNISTVSFICFFVRLSQIRKSIFGSISSISQTNGDIGRFRKSFWNKYAFNSLSLFNTLAPVFRAENANTHRHLCEFVGLDIEMQIKQNYHETLELLKEMLIYIFENIEKRYSNLISLVSQQYHVEPLVYKPALVLEYSQGLSLLREAGIEMGEFEDLR